MVIWWLLVSYGCLVIVGITWLFGGVTQLFLVCWYHMVVSCLMVSHGCLVVVGIIWLFGDCWYHMVVWWLLVSNGCLVVVVGVNSVNTVTGCWYG